MKSEVDSGQRHAVLFRTHFWDEFASRQYDRLAEQSSGADLFILVDETNGPVAIDRKNVFRYTQNDLQSLGLAAAGSGNVLWFNGDYSLYAFFSKRGDYDYYTMVEYDVAVNVPLDQVVAEARRSQVDFIGLTTVQPDLNWNFTDGCLDVYQLEDIQQRLICIALFSRRAVQHLLDRRLEHSEMYRAGKIQRWPFCEAYIPTELSLVGFKMIELSKFGPTDFYDWRPAFVETDLPLMKKQAFVHPVLDPARYIDHTMKHAWPPEGFFYPGSGVGRRIRRVPAGVYFMPLTRALKKRFADGFKKHVLRASADGKGGGRQRPAESRS